MASEGDRLLSTELDHLINATESMSDVRISEKLREAIFYTRTLAINEKAELDDAVQDVDDDQSENRAVTLKPDHAIRFGP